MKTRLGTLKFEKGFPTKETARKLFDEMDYQRAVQAYLWAYPAVSFESIRIATKAAGIDLTSRCTPNTDGRHEALQTPN